MNSSLKRIFNECLEIYIFNKKIIQDQRLSDTKGSIACVNKVRYAYQLRIMKCTIEFVCRNLLVDVEYSASIQWLQKRTVKVREKKVNFDSQSIKLSICMTMIK